jgi:hypothetical protein
MRRGGPGGRRIRVVLALLAAAALILVLAQIFLPGIAASTIRSRVGRYGVVDSVSVSAWPAIKLLWGSADSVTMRASRLALTPARSAALLSEAGGTDSLDVAVASVQEGSLHLSGAHLRKRGAELTGEGTMTPQDVRAALPPGVDVRLLGSSGGQVTVRVSGGLFGLGASVDAAAGPSEGRLVAHPLGLLLGGLRLTLFSDRRIRVQGVAASVESLSPLRYRLQMRAVLE